MKEIRIKALLCSLIAVLSTVKFETEAFSNVRCCKMEKLSSYGTMSTTFRAKNPSALWLPIASKTDVLLTRTHNQGLTVSLLSPQSSFLINDFAIESWRQYVPLVVACGVIIDILLGSPIVNMIVAPMKRQAEEEKEKTGVESKLQINERERVDSKAIAMEAIQKAEYGKDLRKFLDDNKTEYDKMKDMRRKIDGQIDNLAENLEKIKDL